MITLLVIIMTGSGATEGALHSIQAPFTNYTQSDQRGAMQGPRRGHAGATKLHLTASIWLPTSLGTGLALLELLSDIKNASKC